MLDVAILDQLKSIFQKLENEITLVPALSNHEKQAELLEMLTEVASTSKKISIKQSQENLSYPHFHIEHQGKHTGVSFSGIPGGHEFNSFVLAILNADGKGKFPDEMIQSRIKNLKGPIRLKTFIALSCETCPDVVQALNLMAFLHPDFEHQMVDGEFVQEEVERLKIQGVPSVFHGDKMISSGRNDLLGLLEKLDQEFSSQLSVEAKDLGDYDVVVVGAGPAGASAAIYTARKGLKTAIITDRFGGQLQDTQSIQNMISIPYTEGPRLSAQLAAHVAEYDNIEVLEHRRVENIENGDLKLLSLNSSETLRTKSLIVATGAKWRNLGIEGEKEYLGRGVHYCPHCDGPYYKSKDVAVIGGGNSGVEAAIDLAGIVRSVTLFEFMPELKADKVLVDKLQSLPNATIVRNARTHKIVGNTDKVTALEYEDRSSGQIKTQELAGVFVQIGLIPNSAFVKDIVETNKFGEIIVDAKGRSSAKGIYAAGDVTTVPYKQIIIAMGEGAKAGLAAFEDIAF